VDELKEAEVDEKVCELTSLLKKSDVPKMFRTRGEARLIHGYAMNTQ
jgi:hypothetical protein